MSLGNDFIGGFQATRAIREKRLDRDQQSALEKARRDLELERDLKRGQLERDLQGERLTADATKQANAQTFQAGEGEKDRGFRRGERIGSQDYQSGESKLERDARLLATERTLNQAAQQFTKRLDFDQQNMRLGAGLKAREQNWRENPENPENKWRDARADQVEDLRAPFAPPAPGAPKAPGAGTPKMITTKAEYDALPSGARFSWNGRNGVKN